MSEPKRALRTSNGQCTAYCDSLWLECPQHRAPTGSYRVLPALPSTRAQQGHITQHCGSGRPAFARERTVCAHPIP